MVGNERQLILIAHNLRSCHNVGSLLRTCDGLGVSKIFLTGYTPYPAVASDNRLPHLVQKLSRQIHKTALGAEDYVAWEHVEKFENVLSRLKATGFTVAALEQAKDSVQFPDYKPPGKIAMIVGHEAKGIEPEILAACDLTLEIPMLGHKESFNVVQAAAMAFYHCRFGC